MSKLFLVVTLFLFSFYSVGHAADKPKDAHAKADEKASVDETKPALQKMPTPQPVVQKHAPLKLTSLLISLLQVQDRIARGDQAALKLQKHLMKLLDAGISEHGSDWNITPPQFRALVIFGIVGTGSNAVVGALNQVQEPPADVRLARAIVHYRQRQRDLATKEFARIKLGNLDARLVPFVAFARGNLMSRSRPNKAIRSYDIVRLSAPGTLLEETSLRRLMMLYSTRKNGKGFVSAAKQYATRFINSPYRDQYLTLLRTGIFSMRQSVTLDDVGAIGDLMPANYAVAFHMHLLHQAVISGYIKLAEHSIGKISLLLEANEDIKLDETKLALLKLLSRIRGDDPAGLLSELEALDRSKLDEKDKELHSAATNILRTILSPIELPVSSVPVKEKRARSEGEMPTKAKDVSSTPTPHDKVQTSGTEDSIEDFIGKTQEKLSQIDVMLSQ